MSQQLNNDPSLRLHRDSTKPTMNLPPTPLSMNEESSSSSSCNMMTRVYADPYKPLPPLLDKDGDGEGIHRSSFPIRLKSPSNFSYANEVYGHQTLTPSRPVFTTILGRLDSRHMLRRRQVNTVVTSGVTPAGGHNGFGQHASWAERQANLAEAEVASASLSTGVKFEDIAIISPLSMMPIRTIVLESAILAINIRSVQHFKDGNHRTALLTFVLNLAQHNVLLTRNFDIYRAYIITSAREHPSNQENSLDANGISETADILSRYARRRVKSGLADWSYIAHWAEIVRRLILRASIVEEVFEGIKALPTTGEQVKAWRTLDRGIKRDLKLAHASYHGPWNGFTPK
ncbi:hypothetical protein BCR39DRAFT_506023 [Naematelia encephala]|uniref:Fido domain-containing protein n=1 Tax=Naematelia encephala TaxID=71784 RepID=A0A1Y2B1S3_9TREE|nr:hypothetical protein BCR39DRAFT_506023 [Naematelia encephala]